MEWLISELKDDPAGIGYEALGRNYGGILAAMTASTPAVYKDEVPPTVEVEYTKPVPITFAAIKVALTDEETVALPRLHVLDAFEAMVLAGERTALEASGLEEWVLTNSNLGEDPALYDVVRYLLDANETAMLGALVQLLTASGKLSVETAEELSALMTKTETVTVEEVDPDWKPTRISEAVPSRLSVLGQDAPTTADIRTAINSIGDWGQA